MNFSNQLKKAMEARNISQLELSEQTGLGKSSVSQYVSGKNVPKDRALKKLADALDCSVEYLLATEKEVENGNIEGIKKLTVAEAAKRLGVSRQSVRRALQNKTAPFGYAVWNPKAKFRPYSYHISEKKLSEYNGTLRKSI